MFRKISIIALLAVFVFTCAAFGQGNMPPVPPSKNVVQLVSPKVGEIWELASTQTVIWQMLGSEAIAPDSIQLLLLTSEGKELPLASFHKENPLTWKWSNVGPEGKKLRMQIIVHIGKTAYKDAHVFAIVAAVPPQKPTPSPLLIVKAPNGGESWIAGKTKTIRWDFTGMSNGPAGMVFSVLLSRDGGKSYTETLAKDLSMKTTSYKWIVTGPGADLCRVKVMLSGPSNAATYEDVSDKDFVIVPVAERPHHGDSQR